ncbi:MAG: glycine dehydrogenase, partial [Atopobiaceae bacterium]|nr:glycine dehydrogenase [Atopobiaceae bacterium]
MGSFIPVDARETDAMLGVLGLDSLDGLYGQVPPEVLIDHLDIAPGVSELEALAHMEDLAAQDVRFKGIFRGAGAYRHYIPAIVKTVTSKEEFLTAYTPYQAEISQGELQSNFEYQTQMCELTGMDVSNASVYDGATAAAEGLLM